MATNKERQVPEVKVYTTTFCPYCVAAKKLLKKENIDFEEINLSGHGNELDALKKRTGMRTVPQVFIGEKLIGGYTELSELHISGELAQLLKA